MNINPFELIKNFQNMQTKMKDFQEKLKDITATGTSGGDMVSVEIDGQMNIMQVRIAPEAAGDLEMLQDLVQAATNDALIKIKERIREQASEITGGMNIPPGFMGM